jgi:hypothetical protein
VILKNKMLWIGLILSIPAIAVLAARKPHNERPPTAPGMANAEDGGRMKVPVEVVGKDGRKEWVIVEVPVGTIPEPGTCALLVTFSSLLLLRRKREE